MRILAQVLRILSRKPVNRQKAAEGDVAAIVRHLTGASREVAAECANVILNLCFERANVSRLLKCNGVAPLVSLLKSPDMDVQASTCGVIQSICYMVRFPTQITPCGDACKIQYQCSWWRPGAQKCIVHQHCTACRGIPMFLPQSARDWSTHCTACRSLEPFQYCGSMPKQRFCQQE